MSEPTQRVLVVEDDAPLLATLRDELTESGFAVDPAVTGEEALRNVEGARPDLVLLDLQPVGLDGLGVLSKLKQSTETKAIPVILLSNVGDEERVREALELGADAYFVKTRYRLPDLVERMRFLLKHGEAQRTRSVAG